MTIAAVEQALRAELLSTLRQIQKEWEVFAERPPDSTGATATDVWNSMPAIDSKAVAETSPIFEKHLRIPLNPTLIRSGGYDSPEEAVDDLVPKMLDEVRRRPPKKTKDGGKVA
ncbi:MAG: hypothetical protein L3K10_03290 [Thermoplasmata archaeon]|nr:hypothetical protein [Thermoplasmata archaeon]